MSGDTFIISGLRERRATVAGQIVDTRRQLEQQLSKLQADLFHVDAVLKLYGVEPADIPAKGRVGKLSAYFGRTELSRRCRDALRENGTVRADAIAVQAMRDKGLDPDKDRKLRTDFNRRILASLHDLHKAGQVEKVGHGRGVRWQVNEAAPSERQDQGRQTTWALSK